MCFLGFGHKLAVLEGCVCVCVCVSMSVFFAVAFQHFQETTLDKPKSKQTKNHKHKTRNNHILRRSFQWNGPAKKTQTHEKQQKSKRLPRKQKQSPNTRSRRSHSLRQEFWGSSMLLCCLCLFLYVRLIRVVLVFGFGKA